MNVAGGNPCPPPLNDGPVQGMSKADANVWRSFRCLSIQLRSISSGSTWYYPSYHHFTKFFPYKRKLTQVDFPEYPAISTSRLIICPHKNKISFYLAINNVKCWPKLYPVNITLPILPQGTSLVHRLMWCMVQARASHSPILVSHELDLRDH